MENKQKDFKGLLYNIEAEQIVLGKIILDNIYFEKVEEILIEDYFYETAHKEIFEYIRNALKKHTIIADSVTLKSFFENNEYLVAVGGSGYLSLILSASIGIIDIVSYAKLIKDLAIKRNIIIISEDLVSNIYKEGYKDSQEQIEIAEKKLFDLGDKVSGNKGFLKISQKMPDVIDGIRKIKESGSSGIKSNFKELDKALGGFKNSDLMILAARPSVGKTAFAINIAYNVAKFFLEEQEKTGEKKSVGFFSLEMSSEQIVSRILTMATKMPSEKLQSGMISSEELEGLSEQSNIISNIPLFIDDTPALTISAIRNRTRRLVKKENLSFLVIDYLQLIHGVSESGKRNRVQEITEISQGLKAIAKEFNIPVLSLSQLSRLVEQRGNDKKPQLSDLRDSGSIEQDADIVMFLHSDYYYLKNKKPNEQKDVEEWQNHIDKVQHIIEVLISKNRNGPTKDITLFYNRSINFFDDYSYREDNYNK